MWRAVAATTVCFGSAQALTGKSASASSQLSADPLDKVRPVTQVVNLLTDMRTKLEKEADSDEEIYDKLACWCENNDKEKAEAIEGNTARLSDLGTRIEELAASKASLTTEIGSLDAEVKQNQDSLDTATALRKKQLEEFNAEEKDMIESIQALKAAVVVLGKHHGDALLQRDLSGHQVSSIVSTVRHQLDVHAKLLQGTLTPAQRRALHAFVQQAPDYLGATPTFKQEYKPQSGEIFGILKQMLATFQENLAASQEEELANQKSYGELKEAKLAEISAGSVQLKAKTEALAADSVKLAQSKEDREDTEETLGVDKEFLTNLKLKCQMTDKDWELRQKTRQEEMQAISEAISLLSSDDARDLFGRTFKASFVQTGVERSASRKQARAAQLLLRAARSAHSPRLAVIAAKTKLDSFTRVKKAIDDMVAQLAKEQADEGAHKDFCTGEFHDNEVATTRKDRERLDVEAKISDLELTIKEVSTAIATTNSSIAEMKVQLKRAGEDREKEKLEFDAVVKDQRDAQAMLEGALEVLNRFYKNQPALVQQDPTEPVAPTEFKSYEKTSGKRASNSVTALIEHILANAKALEQQTMQAETDAILAYEGFQKDTNAAIRAAEEELVNKQKRKSQAELDHLSSKDGHKSVLVELDQMAEYKGGLHKSCDYTLKNFDLRLTARNEEVEALKQAKAILSGAKFADILKS